MIEPLLIEYNSSLIKVLKGLCGALILSFSILSCRNIDTFSEVFISTSGSGELIVEDSPAIPVERMALVVENNLLQLHIMGSGCTIDSLAQIQGSGALTIITIPNNTTPEALPTGNYSIEKLPYACYTIIFDEHAITNDYISITSGTLIIRANSDVYDLRLLALDTQGGSIILSYTGYIYCTIKS